MKLPTLVIPQAKITGYLLDLKHRSGGPKARFFLSHGFNVGDPAALADALIDHAIKGWPGRVSGSPYGDRHEVLGPMVLPDANQRTILAIWQVSGDGGIARFLTAYPV